MSVPALSGLNVLVTRPAHLAQPLCTAIEGLGGFAWRYPTIEIVDTDNQNTFQHALEQLDQVNICIFTSQNAVIKSISRIKQVWSTLPQPLQIAAIGKATASLLEQHDISVQICPKHDFSSEGLLALPALAHVQQQKIMLIRGAGGREHLTNTLQQRGAEIIHAIAYRRQRPSGVELPLPLSEIDIIISTSSESLQNLWEMLEQQQATLREIPLVVISKRMIELVQALGFKQTNHLAQQASNQAIIECLIKYNKGQRNDGKENN